VIDGKLNTLLKTVADDRLHSSSLQVSDALALMI
jgi:hypothetical protein